MAVSAKGAHVPPGVILMGIHWYLAYPLNTRHVEELLEERGVNVDHSDKRPVRRTIPLRTRIGFGCNIRFARWQRQLADSAPLADSCDCLGLGVTVVSYYATRHF